MRKKSLKILKVQVGKNWFIWEKRVKEVLKFHKRTNRKQNSRKGKRFDKSSKWKKVECFNCGGLTHVSSNCPNLKDIKKSMEATWSDTNSNESDFMASKDQRYEQNDFYFYFFQFFSFCCWEPLDHVGCMQIYLRLSISIAMDKKIFKNNMDTMENIDLKTKATYF